MKERLKILGISLFLCVFSLFKELQAQIVNLDTLSIEGMVFDSGFDSLNIRFIGNWPFNVSATVYYDDVNGIAFLGSGGGVYLINASNPLSLKKFQRNFIPEVLSIVFFMTM